MSLVFAVPPIDARCRFLHAFEDFYRKLGSSMGTISRPGARGRHPSASGGRSILSFRDRETPASPRVSSRNEHKVSDWREEIGKAEVTVGWMLSPSRGRRLGRLR